ncbi:MAG: AAA family ATPase, partial [Candidatus Pacebacteria bacterium]|nr:AAA family ATPase [Candidatus Paceibacterota bacterium]
MIKKFKETNIYKATQKEIFFLFLELIEKASIFLLSASILFYIYKAIKNIEIGELLGIIIISFATILISKNLKLFFEDFVKRPKNIKSLKESLNEDRELLSFLNFKSAKYLKKAFRASKNKCPDSTTILKYFLDNKNPRIIFIFSRLLIDFENLKKEISNIKPTEINPDDFISIIKEAGIIALRRKDNNIKEGDIISSLSKFQPNLKNIIINSEIEEEDFEKVNEWQERISIKIKKDREWWSHENLLKLGSLGRDWTAGYTPTLDLFSVDWTDIVQRRGFEDVIGHKDKVEQLERILSKRSAGNALIIGEPGVGKKNIIHGLIRKSLINQSVKEINGNRFIELDIVSLSSNITSYEKMENVLNKCFKEIVHARNVILIINDFHDFLGAKQKAGIIDISGIISSYLPSPYFKTICLTSYKGLHKYVENKPSILAQFQKIEVEEMNKNETIQVLENKVFGLEKENQKFIPFNSLKETVGICEKYIFDFPFPQKAINLL